MSIVKPTSRLGKHLAKKAATKAVAPAQAENPKEYYIEIQIIDNGFIVNLDHGGESKHIAYAGSTQEVKALMNKWLYGEEGQ